MWQDYFFSFPRKKKKLKRQRSRKTRFECYEYPNFLWKVIHLTEITFCLPYKHNAVVTEGQCKTYLDDQKGSEKSLSTHNSLV